MTNQSIVVAVIGVVGSVVVALIRSCMGPRKAEGTHVTVNAIQGDTLNVDVRRMIQEPPESNPTWDDEAILEQLRVCFDWSCAGRASWLMQSTPLDVATLIVDIETGVCAVIQSDSEGFCVELPPRAFACATLVYDALTGDVLAESGRVYDYCVDDETMYVCEMYDV